MTLSFDPIPQPPARTSAPPPDAPRARGRHARAGARPPAGARRRRFAAACLVVALGAGASAAQARKARPAKAASSPSTAQILAPSSATVPDALPPDRAVYRCGDSYSARPCSASQKPLDVADARSEAQRRQSQDVAARDQRLAAWYEAGRRQRETVASSPTRTVAAQATTACGKAKGKEKDSRDKACPPAPADPFAPHMQRVVVSPAPAKGKN